MKEYTQTQLQAHIVDKSIIGCCLEPLLTALHWNGTPRQFREALPHFSTINSPVMFCNVMKNLNYRSNSIRTAFLDIDARLFPCLFVADNGLVLVALNKNDDHYRVFNGEMAGETVLTNEELDHYSLRGFAYFFERVERSEYQHTAKKTWMESIFSENKRYINTALFLSLVINFLSLATPLFIMAVYNQVVGTSSISILNQLIIGIIVATIAYVFLNRLRAKILALIGTRFGQEIGNIIFERLLYLAPVYTESATIGSQVARIKDFDKLREFLSGPLFPVLFDLPFIIIALTIVAILGGELVLIPIILIAIFILLALFSKPKAKRRVNEVSGKSAQLQEFVIETLSKLRSIKYLSLEKLWVQRYRHLSAKNTFANFKVSFFSAINLAVSEMLMIFSGIFVVALGAVKVIEGQLSIGAMIAIMIIIWRILSPIKALFNTIPRLQQIYNSVEQISRLMKIVPENQFKDSLFIEKIKLRGDINFNRVSFRYATGYDPVLLGISFNITAGSLVGIVGRNGSGKSTLLKMILRLYQPQSGNIRIDGHNIHQYRPIELRTQISYLPQSQELFYGTISQNLRLAEPGASDLELIKAAKIAGILQEIRALPKGFDTQIGDYNIHQLSSSFRQGLCLARTYLRKSSILLLDEPGTFLNYKNDLLLLDTLQSFRGKTTVMMVTHRPSHLKIMDKILLLEEGQLLLQGNPEQVLPKIPKDIL